MAFNIGEMKSNLAYGGARPNLFNVTITNPVNNIADIKVPILCRSASVPEGNLGTIMVPYFGRQIKVPGNRTYQEWVVTVLNDEDYLIRNAVEQWQNSINTPRTNVNILASASPQNYKSTATVTSFSQSGAQLRTYQLNGIWPSLVSGIGLDWGQNDSIMEFQIHFQYDDVEVVSSETGVPGQI